MDITQLAEGSALALYAVVSKGSCPVWDYITSLNDSENKQVMALLGRLPDHGPPHNIEKFRHIGDDIYELKTNLGIRILCFFGTDFLRRSLILTHGFPKPKRVQLDREKAKALKIKAKRFKIVNIDLI